MRTFEEYGEPVIEHLLCSGMHDVTPVHLPWFGVAFNGFPLPLAARLHHLSPHLECVGA